MRIRNDGSRWFCIKCGGPHPSAACPLGRKNSGLPLEIPSHNGPYQGTLKVKVIPYGVSGIPDEEDVALRPRPVRKYKPRPQQPHRQCDYCHKLFQIKSTQGRFCSWKCNRAWWKIHRGKRCVTCRKEFFPKQKTQKFCCETCKDKRPRGPKGRQRPTTGRDVPNPGPGTGRAQVPQVSIGGKSSMVQDISQRR